MIPNSRHLGRYSKMLKRKLLFPVILAAAAGGPYVMMDNGWSDAAKEKIQTLWSDGDAPAPIADTGGTGSTVDWGASEYNSEFTTGGNAERPRPQLDTTLTGPPVANFGEIVRFDISPVWVTSRWPRVTTVTAEMGMEGLRVPVVTGTNNDDLAGSLTYYFDRYHRVQRLTFDGYTGDDRKLVTLLTQYYGLRAEPTLDASMYVARWNATPTSVLRVARAPVISADSPRSQLHAMLELNRPSREYGMSPQFVQILERDRHSRRW